MGKTLAAVGSTPAGLVPLRFSKPGAHGLTVGLATGGPTGPPRIKITQDSENQIATTTIIACGQCMGYVKRMVWV